MLILKLKIKINGLHYIWLLYGHTEASENLLSSANIEAQDKDQWTPLHVAAANGHTEAIRELIAAHANIEAQDKDKCTPLHLAAMHGQTEVIKELIAAHANIEAQRQRSTYSFTWGC